MTKVLLLKKILVVPLSAVKGKGALNIKLVRRKRDYHVMFLN